jgi:hypothetical protein
MKYKKVIKIALISLICISISSRSYSQKTGNFETSINYGGVKHTIAYSVPLSYNPSIKYPMIIGLHGCPEPATTLRDALKEFSTQKNVIVMCPDNFGNEITDGGLILRAIDSTRTLYNVDTTMVFLTGFSCGGAEVIRHGLNGLFKFRGIFPWDPYGGGVNYKTYDRTTPIVIAAGGNDGSIANDFILYDSLKAHGTDINLVFDPGVAHEIPVNFTDVMFKSYQYLLDSNKISLSPVPLIEVNSNSPEKSVDIKNIKHTTNAELEVTAYSMTNKIENITVKYAVGSDSAILTFQPSIKTISSMSTLIIVEVKEKSGTAIEQTIIKVNIKVNSKLPISASSQSSFVTGPENAIDGRTGVVWTSKKGDNQWICVDLLKKYAVKGVVVDWNTYYAVAYDIQLSTDSIKWENVYSTTTGKGGKVKATFEPMQAEYVRLIGTQAGSSKIYSIKELQVDTGQMTSIQNSFINKNNIRYTISPNVLKSGNSSINFSYSISNASKVNIEIFNIQGQHIKTIISKYQQAGDYSIYWDAISDQGMPVSDGLYICKLSTPNYQDQKKLLILK